MPLLKALASSQELLEAQAKLAAIDKLQAVIEFELDGTIITANKNFCKAVGYRLDEIQGQHHRIFVDKEYSRSQEYVEFWQRLGRGDYDEGEYKRFSKDGTVIWIQASYNPIFDKAGKPYKVVKYATDITQRILEYANFSGQIDAISKSQAVIEFNMDGTIITANENFCNAVGYSLGEIEEQHHRMFVDPKYAVSAEYKDFWRRLNTGTYEVGEYKRLAKGGKEIWIQASYNPILDQSGKPYKVVKYATDITHHKLQYANFSGQMAAISRSQAVIEFNMDGTIITANENFCKTTGYSLEEIKGKHHRMFVETEYGSSMAYQQFWSRLNNGEFEAGEYKRVAKGGNEIWIQASYNPIFDLNGKPFKVVKYATDITQNRLQNADYSGQISAISKSQATIEFNMDGTIITANENFLATTGYRLDEIQGKHHRMFAENDYANSAEYRQFWENLNRGKYDTGEYKRVGKGGKEIWIQASYNPIFDLNGKPFKVVKYATDITADKLQNSDYTGQISAIGKSQAVIEFDLNGIIQTANDNFTNTVGYSLTEIQGKHHRMFVEPSYGNSDEYQAFWQKLRNGEYQSGEFKRVGKGGKEIWIQASYNPILDVNGRPFKVVKYATDVTERKKAINAISGTLMALSEGDLTCAVKGEFSGEFGQLATTVNETIQRLAHMVGSILSVSDQVLQGAQEISNANMKLSERTEQQASSLEETASSMEEMTSTVRVSADNASEATEAVKTSCDIAQSGKSIVQEAIGAMEDITVASKKISDIIGTIDDIAFQTNLLALNAAVEAARAGDQGRGFAVVAGEVRNLAQRSATSAKEISDLIKDSLAKVERGADMTNQSGSTFEEVVDSVVKVTNYMVDISRAATEQSEGIEQVNRAVVQMDGMTQENAAMVEQATSASQLMVDQVNKLRTDLSFFKIG